nr:unnamed protein product [Digitaria exilis]
MASMATTSALFFLLSAFAARANAATFTITNNCGFTVWPAALPAFPNNANSGLRPTSCPANSSYQVTFCP